jgi:hypothetical protein
VLIVMGDEVPLATMMAEAIEPSKVEVVNKET